MAWGAGSLLDIAAILVAFGTARLVYVSNPSRRLNRLLTLILFLETVALVVISEFVWGFAPADGLRAGILEEEILAILLYLTLPIYVPVPFLYLAFVSSLETPIVRPFRGKLPIVLAIVAGGIAFLGWIEVTIGQFVYLPYFFLPPVFEIIVVGVLASSFFGLIAAISAFRRTAPGTLARDRAKWFMIAFGFRDLFFLLILPLGVAVAVLFPGLGERLSAAFGPISPFSGLVLVYVSILAYGILKSQLFDIDLRIKRGIKTFTIIVAFPIAFVLGASLGSGFAFGVFGYATGAVASGALLLGIRPLSRLSSSFADFVLPHVDNSPDYLAHRKIQVYRNALEEARAPGARPEIEERILRDLRKSFGISESEHRIIEIMLAERRRDTAPRASGGPMRFRIERELGRGAMAQAVLAHDTTLGRKVVLKRPNAAYVADERGREAFLREAKLLAQINHPNVVTIHEVTSDEQGPILVLEFVEGGSLVDRFRSAPRLDVGESARIIAEVLGGLRRVHEAGIIHRDVKPANILLTKDGTAKITDFGIARPPPDLARTATLAASGMQPGTPAYMSPQQARGEDVDERDDLYAVGAVLYECLSGAHYLQTRGASEFRVRQMILDATTPILPKGVPAVFQAVVSRAMAKERRDRFANAAEMRGALMLALGSSELEGRPVPGPVGSPS